MATHYRQTRTSERSTNWLVQFRQIRHCGGSAGLDSTSALQARGDDVDPNPDYDASDELEYGINWFAWILRGVYPPPAYPPV